MSGCWLFEKLEIMKNAINDIKCQFMIKYIFCNI